ncbi:DNA starvation/stationary phase protection protein [bacterium]|nr:DNA starvation/stationary phase protection protein [bacterium]
MLVDNMKTLLGSSVSLYIKAANFHWNVEGPDFPQYHEFFGEYYADIYGTIDQIAEYIRALDSYTPASLKRFQELSLIPDQTMQQGPMGMFQELFDSNATMLSFLNSTFDVATLERQQGIANFIAERIDAHQKHQWMIRSILKSTASL